MRLRVTMLFGLWLLAVIECLGVPSAGEAWGQLDAIQKLISEGETREANIRLQGLEVRYLDEPAIQLRVHESYVALGDSIRSEDCLKRILRTSPNDEARAAAYDSASRAFLLAGDFTQALRYARLAIRTTSRDETRRIFERNLEELEQRAAQVTRGELDNVQAFLSESPPNYGRAMQAIQLVLKYRPRDEEGLRLLAGLLAVHRRHADAARVYDTLGRVANLGPETSEHLAAMQDYCESKARRQVSPGSIQCSICDSVQPPRAAYCDSCGWALHLTESIKSAAASTTFNWQRDVPGSPPRLAGVYYVQVKEHRVANFFGSLLAVGGAMAASETGAGGSVPGEWRNAETTSRRYALRNGPRGVRGLSYSYEAKGGERISTVFDVSPTGSITHQEQRTSGGRHEQDATQQFLVYGDNTEIDPEAARRAFGHETYRGFTVNPNFDSFTWEKPVFWRLEHDARGRLTSAVPLPAAGQDGDLKRTRVEFRYGRDGLLSSVRRLLGAVPVHERRIAYGPSGIQSELITEMQGKKARSHELVYEWAGGRLVSAETRKADKEDKRTLTFAPPLRLPGSDPLPSAAAVRALPPSVMVHAPVGEQRPAGRDDERQGEGSPRSSVAVGSRGDRRPVSGPATVAPGGFVDWHAAQPAAQPAAAMVTGAPRGSLERDPGGAPNQPSVSDLGGTDVAVFDVRLAGPPVRPAFSFSARSTTITLAGASPGSVTIRRVAERMAIVSVQGIDLESSRERPGQGPVKAVNTLGASFLGLTESRISLSLADERVTLQKRAIGGDTVVEVVR